MEVKTLSFEFSFFNVYLVTALLFQFSVTSGFFRSFSFEICCTLKYMLIWIFMSFLWSFSPYHCFKKASCQLLVKLVAQSTG